jgi:4-amino-4-deoxy-L-arabinose transferase-like glycosyltransferase
MTVLVPAPTWRRDLACLSVVMVVIYLLTANHGPLSSSTRYYEASREMAELGDWVVPHLAYAPYVEKPPLVYWLGAGARLLGDHPLITSLPSLLASLVTMVATYLFGSWWRGRVVGLAAAGLLIGSSFAAVMSGVLTTDPLLAATLSVAFLLWWRWDLGERTQQRWLYGFYLAVAIGWLAKGPIALILPGAVIALHALLRGGVGAIPTTLWVMRPWWGVAIIILVNLPWTLALMARDPRMLEFFYVRINLDAFFKGNYNHPGPWWYYGPILCASLVPFTGIALPLLLQSIWGSLRRLRWTRSGPATSDATEPTTLYLTSVVLGGLVFLSFSSAKLGTYLMPIMPAIFLLLADVMHRWQVPPRWVTWLVVAQSGLVLLIAGLAPVVLTAVTQAQRADVDLVIAGITLAERSDLARLDWSYGGMVVLGLGFLALASLGSVLAILTRRTWPAFGTMSLGVILLLATVMPYLERLAPRRDLSPLVANMRTHGWTGDQPSPAQRDIVLVNESTVHDYEILLALRQRAGIWGNTRETGVGYFIEATKPETPLPGPGQPIIHPYKVNGDNTAHPWLWSTKRLIDDWQGPRRVWMLTEEDELPALQRLGLTTHTVSRAGHNVLVSNQP